MTTRAGRSPGRRVELDIVGERPALLLIGMAGVWAACLVFAVVRLVETLEAGRPTPWWANAAGFLAMSALYAWYRARPRARTAIASHATAVVATLTLLVPVAYGMTSTIWWLALVGFAMVLLGRRGEAWVWGVAIPLVVVAAVVLEPALRVQGTLGESRVEKAFARTVFALLVVAMAAGFRWVAEQRSLGLHQSEETTRALIDAHQTAAILLDTTGTILAANLRAADSLGTTAARLLGSNLLHHLEADDARRLRGLIDEVVGAGTLVELEWEWRAGVWDVAIYPICDPGGAVTRLAVVAEEVTERRRNERALHESEERFRTLVELMGEGVGIQDEHDRFLLANPALERILGVEPGTLCGRSLFDFLDEHGAALIREQTGRRLAGKTDHYELAITRPDREVRHLMVTATPGLTHGASQTIVGVCHDITERKRAEEVLAERTRQLERLNVELERLSTTDPLTGLANRRHFNDRLDQEWRRARRTGASLALVSLDVDHFKEINDAQGHLRGDACLQRLGAHLAAAFGRASDLAARLGGDEFCVILANTSLDEASHAAEELRRAFEGFAIPRGVVEGCAAATLSLGVAAGIPRGEVPADALLRVADEALYMAKERGRNRVCALPLERDASSEPAGAAAP